MPEEDIIRALDKMIFDREELLRHVSNSAIRKEVDALTALRAGYRSVLDLESEYKIMQKKYKHREDEVNKLRCELAELHAELTKLHAELDEAKRPKRYYEVLFSDGSSTRVVNAVVWNMSDTLTRLRDEGGRTVAAFKTDDIRGLIKRGEWKKDED